MEKSYDPQNIEKQWAQAWENAGYFTPSGKGEPYCIVIPPPNVTGSLHLGHGFQCALMDTLTRYHRMCGFNTLWQVGTDHAGIATQMLVMQKLIAQGQNPYEMGREQVENCIWEWKKYSQQHIGQQMRRFGISVDWARERFTLDEDFSKAVHKVFIDLYNEGLIYRGKKLVNWDPVLETAVSDLEVVSIEQAGSLWHIRYPIENSKEFVIIATTRPETMLGDTAIAVHPHDSRYQHLIGKHAILPIVDRRIPIIADDYVDPDFGTGCVKITPAHDFNDYLVGQRHNLPIINIFTSKATINENAPKNYQGLDRFEARKKIIEELTAKLDLVKIEAYTIKIPKGDRSGTILEPLLSDQWFVKTKVLAKPAIDAVESGAIKFVPENWNKTYLQWLYNIEDWCISRQLWWGHRIPVWYDNSANIYVGENEADVRHKYNLTADIILKQDESVLDTWFSSALWPFATMGWPQDTVEFRTFYPTSVLVTGFDIIFFWVARMVMMGLKFTNKIPFKEVYITGLIRDSEGQKMSKSKGNVLDPIDLVDGISLEDLLKKRTENLMQSSLTQQVIAHTKREFPNGIKPYGVDALRFTFCALASTGRDINFDVNRLEGYRNFCNKIWNAARFVLMQQLNITQAKIELTLVDRWIYSRLQKVINSISEAIAIYRFDLMAQAIYDFVWHEFCDWYLEFCKAYKPNPKTIATILEIILRLIHPIMPFITEEIWQKIAPIVGKTGKTIMLESYPQVDPNFIDETIEHEVDWIQKIVLCIRNIRGEMNISPNKPLSLMLQKGTQVDRNLLAANEFCLLKLANLANITWIANDNKPPEAATALIGALELYVPLADIVDLAAEKARLQKEISKLEKDITAAKIKLSNENFVNRAPREIVVKEQQNLTEKEAALLKLQKQTQLLG